MLGTWKNRAWRPCVCRKTCWMARLVCSFPLGDWFILCKGNTQGERERESWEFCLNGGRSINMRRDVSGVSAATGGSERSICHNVFGPSVRLIVSFRYCFAPPVECKKNVTSPAGWIQITYGDSWNLFFFQKGIVLERRKESFRCTTTTLVGKLQVKIIRGSLNSMVLIDVFFCVLLLPAKNHDNNNKNNDCALCNYVGLAAPRRCRRMCGAAHQPKSVHSAARSALLGHLGVESGRAIDRARRRDRSPRYVRHNVQWWYWHSKRANVILLRFLHDCANTRQRLSSVRRRYFILIFLYIHIFTWHTGNAFPDLVPPSNKVVYDTLGKLIRDRKVSKILPSFIVLASRVWNMLGNSSLPDRHKAKEKATLD